MSLKVILCLITFTTAVVFTSTFAQPARAYDRKAATDYSDYWALKRNFPAYPILTGDCANFASQAMRAGGYKQANWDNSLTNDNEWFFWWNVLSPYMSHSWSVAADHYRFQMLHIPGGYLKDGPISSSYARYWSRTDNYYMINGDELFYNWSGDTNPANINHVAVQSYYNASPYNGTIGDLVNYHTTDRRHALWNLADVNPDFMKTVIWEVHIDNTN